MARLLNTTPSRALTIALGTAPFLAVGIVYPISSAERLLVNARDYLLPSLQSMLEGLQRVGFATDPISGHFVFFTDTLASLERLGIGLGIAAIAQALICRPKVLLLDEPFGALDPETRAQLHRVVLGLWQESRTTIVMVTHDLTEARTLVTQLVSFGFSAGGGGTIVSGGSPAQQAVVTALLKEEADKQTGKTKENTDNSEQSHITKFALDQSEITPSHRTDDQSHGKEQ